MVVPLEAKRHQSKKLKEEDDSEDKKVQDFVQNHFIFYTSSNKQTEEN